MTSKRRILVIGSGKRVREAALPVIARAEEFFELDGILSRTPKFIESEGHDFDVGALSELTAARLSEVDLIYMVVSKPAVPKLLARLNELDVSHLDLLIETPVMLVRHLGHRSKLEAFRNVWVSEDCITLPCFDALRACLAAGEIGELRSVTFDRSAYAYHGMAMVKSLLGAKSIRRAKQRKHSAKRRERTIEVDNGLGATIFDPRDYSLGSMHIQGSSGSVSDRQAEHPNSLLLSAELEGEACTGIRAGESHRSLTPAERELMGQASQGEGITAWMDGMKRVGFLALLRRIADGQGAYPLGAAIEDSVVDYHLEKFGRYRATPWTRPDAPLTRMAFSLLTRLTDR